MLKKIKDLLFSSSRTEAEKQTTYLYNKYKPLLIGYVCKYYPVDETIAQEIYQDVFMVLYENIRTGKLTDPKLKGKLATYLIGIAKNKMLKYFEHQNRLREVSLPETLEEMGDTDNMDVWLEKQDIVERLVEGMGDPCKTILSLFYWQRKNMHEIAEAMNYKSEQSAKNKKSDCYKNLRERVIEKFRKEDLI